MIEQEGYIFLSKKYLNEYLKGNLKPSTEFIIRDDHIFSGGVCVAKIMSHMTNYVATKNPFLKTFFDYSGCEIEELGKYYKGLFKSKNTAVLSKGGKVLWNKIVIATKSDSKRLQLRIPKLHSAGDFCSLQALQDFLDGKPLDTDQPVLLEKDFYGNMTVLMGEREIAKIEYFANSFDRLDTLIKCIDGQPAVANFLKWIIEPDKNIFDKIRATHNEVCPWVALSDEYYSEIDSITGFLDLSKSSQGLEASEIQNLKDSEILSRMSNMSSSALLTTLKSLQLRENEESFLKKVGVYAYHPDYSVSKLAESLLKQSKNNTSRAT